MPLEQEGTHLCKFPLAFLVEDTADSGIPYGKSKLYRVRCAELKSIAV